MCAESFAERNVLRIRSLAARQEGVVSAAQLRDAGWSRPALTRCEWLVPVTRGVYAVGHTSLSQRAYLWVAHLATGGVISHGSAAFAHRLVDRLAAPIHVIGAGKRRRGIEVHRSRWLPPEHVVSQGGLPATSVARTIADLEGTAQRRALREATYLRTLDHAQLPLLLTRHPARARLRAALERNAPTAGARFRSSLEHRLMDVIHDGGLPVPEVNVVVAGKERDFYWPAHRLVAEADGGQHDRGAAPLIDRRRDRELLAATGIRTVRFTDEDSTTDLAQTLQALLIL